MCACVYVFVFMRERRRGGGERNIEKERETLRFLIYKCFKFWLFSNNFKIQGAEFVEQRNICFTSYHFYCEFYNGFWNLFSHTWNLSLFVIGKDLVFSSLRKQRTESDNTPKNR